MGPSPKGGLAHVRFRCKGYGCRICGPKKLRRVRKAIVRHAVALGLHRFVTLTLDPKKLGRDTTFLEGVRYLRECWRKMRVSLQRKLGKSLTFISVVELHGSGVPHLHVLVGSYVPQEWLSIAWQAVGGGRIVDIRRVEIRRVAAYLANYMTKEKLLDDFPKGVRRFSTSRGLSLFERSKDGSGWVIARLPIDAFYNFRATQIEPGSEKYETDIEGTRELVWFVAECGSA